MKKQHSEDEEKQKKKNSQSNISQKDNDESNMSNIGDKENNDEIILTTDCRTQENKYQVKKKLTIDKKTNKPKKLEVQDVNQNITVYILYNEISYK